MSRRVLLSFLELTGQQWYEFALTINPHQLGGPIGWKGNEPDPMWIHVARELTEYWMHHQHICQPLGKMSLREARFVHPVLGTFVHAFPQTYRSTAAPVDTLVKIVITGEGGGEWHLIREESHWELYADSDLTPAVTVRIDVDSAWRMFTKGITPEQLRRQAAIDGDTALGEIALNTVAIIA